MPKHLAVAALQQIGLECACCRQIYRPAKALDDWIEAAVFGADPYVICPICEMNVPSDMRDVNYKRRCRRAMKLNFRKQGCALLMALAALTNHAPTPERDSLFDLMLRKAQIRFPDKTWPELKQLGEALWSLLRKQ